MNATKGGENRSFLPPRFPDAFPYPSRLSQSTLGYIPQSTLGYIPCPTQGYIPQSTLGYIPCSTLSVSTLPDTQRISTLSLCQGSDDKTIVDYSRGISPSRTVLNETRDKTFSS